MSATPEMLAAAAADGIHTSGRAMDRLSLAHDASHYVLIPAGIARPEDAGEVAALMRLSLGPPTLCVTGRGSIGGARDLWVSVLRLSV